MRLHLLNNFITSFGLSFIVILTCIYPSNSRNAQAQRKYFCGAYDGVPSTMVRTSFGDEPLIRWTVQDFSRSRYTPQVRCEEVSSRFQHYSDHGTFYITYRKELKGYPVLCITDKKTSSYKESSDCSGRNVLVTLKKNVDPAYALDQLSGGSSSIVSLSGGHATTYVKGVFYVDVNKLVAQREQQRKKNNSNKKY
jgi:Circadian oscillating protein COP23